MDTHDSRPRLRRPSLAQLFVTLAAALVLVCGFAASTATTPQEDEERKFEDRVPAHVPLKVKLKNERAFKDKKNKEWARDLEIEVKNTGSKPIYFMYMVFILPDFTLEGDHPLAFTVMYGRHQLADLEAPLEPDDVPVRPGESVTLKVSEEQWRGYESIRGKKNKADAQKVRLDMQMVSFGDGTGYDSSAGVFITAPPRRSSRESPREESSGGCRPPPARAADPPAKIFRASYLSEPADLLRVDFLEAKAAPPSAPARACNCQNIPNCFYGTLQCPHHCECTNNCQFLAHVSTGNCSDPRGRCRQVQMVGRPCETFHGERNCFFDIALNACAVTDPTPEPSPEESPSPVQSPTPAPTCDPATKLNETNCICNTVLAPGRAIWDCQCPAGAEPANYPQYGPANQGCRDDKVNDGEDCCRCRTGAQPCPGGRWDPGDCKCVPTPMPTPSTGGGGVGVGDCSSGGNFPGTGFQPIEGGASELPERSCASPVLVDVSGDGFALTDAPGGVRFDLDADGAREGWLAWTVVGSDDAWLALDRDGDGLITSGRELFGNFTPQPDPPPGEERNGFLALAEFDRPHNGGNGDGLVDARDAVFARLRLWLDSSHDGVSQPQELHTLAALDVVRLHLDYKESRRADGHGNRFRYRAKVDDARGAKAGRWAWDVFLVAAP
jgi:hypothetical protein